MYILQLKAWKQFNEVSRQFVSRVAADVVAAEELPVFFIPATVSASEKVHMVINIQADIT